MSIYDRQVSYSFLMRLMIGLILTHVRRLGTVTCHNSQKGVGKDCLQFTAINERTVQRLKNLLHTKKINALREFLQARIKFLLVNLTTGFPASFNPCRCTATYFAI